MTNNDKREQLRRAAAEALDYPINEIAFQVCDDIADAILNDGIREDYDIVSTVEPVYTRDIVDMWLALNAGNAYALEHGGYPQADGPIELMSMDLSVLLEAATAAALAKYAELAEGDDQ